MESKPDHNVENKPDGSTAVVSRTSISNQSVSSQELDSVKKLQNFDRWTQRLRKATMDGENAFLERDAREKAAAAARAAEEAAAAAAAAAVTPDPGLVSGAFKSSMWAPATALSVNSQDTFMPAIPPESVAPGSVFGPASIEEQSLPASMTASSFRQYLVTVPFTNTRRGAYLNVLYEHNSSVVPFSDAFCTDGVAFPANEHVAGVKAMCAALFDLCDFPLDHIPRHHDHDETQHREIVRKHAVDSNSKYLFTSMLLEGLKGSSKKVLIVARSERILKSLDAIIQAQGPLVDATAILPDQTPLYPTWRYDLIIGHDSSFSASTTYKLLSSSSSGPSPLVLSLVLEYSIEHFDLNIPHDMATNERLNAVVFMLGQCKHQWDVGVNFGCSYERLHDIAMDFVDKVLTGREVTYAPRQIPPEWFEFYSTQERMSQSPSLQDDDQGTKKRKLDLPDEGASKRTRLIDVLDMTGAPPMVAELLAMDKPESSADDDWRIPVPVSQLQAWHARILDYEVRDAAARTIDDTKKALIDRLQGQITSYESTHNTIHTRYTESVVSRNVHELKAKNAQTALDAATAKIAVLEERLKVPTEEADLNSALAKIADLERRVASKDNELGYSREAYQRVSLELQQAIVAADAGLAEELEQLRRENKQLQSKADAVVATRITAAQNELELTRRISELEMKNANLVSELTRLAEKCAQYEKARPMRTTRQASVPRSHSLWPPHGEAASAPVSRRGSPAATNPNIERLKD